MVPPLQYGRGEGEETWSMENGNELIRYAIYQHLYLNKQAKTVRLPTHVKRTEFDSTAHLKATLLSFIMFLLFHPILQIYVSIKVTSQKDQFRCVIKEHRL